MIDEHVNQTSLRTLIVGFSPAASIAARTLLRQGQPRHTLLVLAMCPAEESLARSIGLQVGPTYTTRGITRYFGSGLSKIIVDIKDDDAAALIRTARRLVPKALILVHARNPGSVENLMKSGASQVFCNAALAGKMLAATLAPLPDPRMRSGINPS